MSRIMNKLMKKHSYFTDISQNACFDHKITSIFHKDTVSYLYWDITGEIHKNAARAASNVNVTI